MTSCQSKTGRIRGLIWSHIRNMIRWKCKVTPSEVVGGPIKNRRVAINNLYAMLRWGELKRIRKGHHHREPIYMKPQIRYKTRRDIIYRIDRYLEKQKSTANEIYQLHCLLTQASLAGTLPLWELRAKTERKEKLERRQLRIVRNLNRLKDRLAEFETPLLSAFDNGDRSVAA